MDLESGGDFGCGLVTLEGSQGDFGLERCAILLAFLAHDSPPCGDDESELRHLSKFLGPPQSPEQLKNFSQGLVAIAFFASNILFWKKEGYFSEPAEENPLLHTWSLAVEEQFYIFFPLILAGLWRFGKQPIFYIVLALTIISFTLSEWGWRNAPGANWYLLPTRAWELGIGAACAFIVYKYPVRSNQLLSVIGLASILYSVLFFTDATPFPSIYAVLPVMGTALIILFGSDGTFVATFLRTRILVGIGLVSFSAYLWHQPLFAFARIKSIHEPSILVFLCLAVASLALACFSWTFVENPFRNPKKVSKHAIFSVAAVASTSFMAIGIIGHYNEGFNYRVKERVRDFTRQELEIYESVKVEALQCLNTDREPDTPCQLTKGVGRSVAIIGDSHAARLRWPLEQIISKVADGYLMNLGGCPPVLDAYVINGNYEVGRCKSFHQKAFEFVRDEDVDIVILVGRWSLYTSGDYQGRTDRYLLSPSPGNHFLRIEDSRSNFSELFPDTIKKYQNIGAQVILAHQAPQQEVDAAKIVERLIMTSEDSFLQDYVTLVSNTSVPEDKHSALQHFYKDVFSSIQDVQKVSFDNEFCKDGACPWGDSDGAFYTDSDHLSRHGSLRITAKLRHALASN